MRTRRLLTDAEEAELTNVIKRVLGPRFHFVLVVHPAEGARTSTMLTSLKVDSARELLHRCSVDSSTYIGQVQKPS